jgi:phospholipase/carboxylesterase
MITHEETRLAKSGHTKKLILMLHGVGSNGSDLIDFADYLDLNQYTTYISPNAPHAYDMAPIGYQWFSLADRSINALYQGLLNSADYFHDYIDRKLLEFHLRPEDLIVIGFSQGAMMALHHMPRGSDPIGGVIAISGALINPDALASQIQSRPELLLIHGDQDEVVPFAAMSDAKSAFSSLGVLCDTFVMQHSGHNITQKALQQIHTYLERKNCV